MGRASETGRATPDGASDRAAEETSQLLRFQTAAISDAIPRERGVQVKYLCDQTQFDRLNLLFFAQFRLHERVREIGQDERRNSEARGRVERLARTSKHIRAANAGIQTNQAGPEGVETPEKSVGLREYRDVESGRMAGHVLAQTRRRRNGSRVQETAP